MNSSRFVAMVVIALSAVVSHAAEIVRSPTRRVAIRLVEPPQLRIGPASAPGTSPGSGAANDPDYEPVFAIDGRGEWRYFLSKNELSNGPITPLGPDEDSLDDRRRASEITTLMLPPFVGAALWLPSLPVGDWKFEIEGSVGAGSSVVATLVFLSNPLGPVPDRIEPGSIRSRLRTESVEIAVFPRADSGTILRLATGVPKGAVSAMLLLSNHGPRVERITAARCYESTLYGELRARGAIDPSGLVTLGFGTSEARAWVIPRGESRVTTEFDLGSGAYLSGRARDLTRTSGRSSEFVVEVTTVGKEPRRFTIVASARTGEFSVDLSRFAGSRVTIRFLAGRDSIAIAEALVTEAGESSPPVVILVLEGVTVERFLSRGDLGGRTPILDSRIRSPHEVAPTVVTPVDVGRSQEDSGLRRVVYAPHLPAEWLTAFDRGVVGDFLEAPTLETDPEADPFSDALATSIGRDGVPARLVLVTNRLGAAYERGAAAEIAAGYAVLDRRVGDLVRGAIDAGFQDDLRFVVLLREGEGWVRLGAP